MVGRSGDMGEPGGVFVFEFATDAFAFDGDPPGEGHGAFAGVVVVVGFVVVVAVWVVVVPFGVIFGEPEGFVFVVFGGELPSVGGFVEDLSDEGDGDEATEFAGFCHLRFPIF